jgi:vanillate O-demethylase ferredoxin subunit
MPPSPKPSPARTQSLRKTIFDLHLLAGLIAGLFLLVASVSGVLLVFRGELDERFNPHLFTVAPGEHRLPLDEILARVHRAYPDGEFDFAEFRPASDASMAVIFRDKNDVYVDPYTGEILGRRNKNDTFFYVVERLHRYLFLGKQGQWITGTATCALLFMLASGIYLWMPKSLKGLKTAFTVKSGTKGRARNVSLHKVIGIYAAIILAVSAVTGLADFGEWILKTYFHKVEEARAIARAANSTAPALSEGPFSWERAWRAAQARIPRFQIARFAFPVVQGGPIKVEMVAADAPHPNALSYVFLDSRTGNVLRVAPYERESLGSRLYLWTLPLHLGQVGGWIGRLLTLGGALCLSALVLTGGWLFYRRKINPVKRAAPVAASPGRAPSGRERVVNA